MSDWIKIWGRKYRGDREYGEHTYFINLDKISHIQMDDEDKDGGVILLHEYEDGLSARIIFDYEEKIKLLRHLGGRNSAVL